MLYLKKIPTARGDKSCIWKNTYS